MIAIDWLAFGKVFAAALVGAGMVVFFYSLGLRMMIRAGKVPRVTSADFTDAIMVVTPKDIRRAEKATAKAAKRPPLTQAQRLTALVIAYVCFALCVAAVVAGLLLIILGSHG